MEFVKVSVKFDLNGEAKNVFNDLVAQAHEFVAEGQFSEAKLLIGVLYGCMHGALREAAKLELAVIERDLDNYNAYCQLREEVISLCYWITNESTTLSDDEQNEYYDVLQNAKALKVS